MITVEELISVLQTVPDKTVPVRLTNDYGIALDIQSITRHKFLFDFVVLGTNHKYLEKTGDHVIWNSK